MPTDAVKLCPPIPTRREPRALVPITAALVWAGAGQGIGWWLFAAVPFALLLTAGVALGTRIYELRVHQLHAMGAAAGVVAALAALVSGHSWAAVAALLLSLWSFLTAARVALLHEPRVTMVPDALPRLALDVKAAADEVVLGALVSLSRAPQGPAAEVVLRELQAYAEVVAQDRAGTLIAPQGALHPTPEAPRFLHSRMRDWRGIAYEDIALPTRSAPIMELPGLRRYRRRVVNDALRIRVFQHLGKDRPWLLCIHGYRMGQSLMDFGLYPPRYLHQKLGYNLVVPYLPLHGPRAKGVSGDGYLDGQLLDTLHTQLQATADLRTALAWIRDQDQGARIGVMGVSLGGYNAALLAGFEAQLDFVMGAIPLSDPFLAIDRHLPSLYRRYFTAAGFDLERLQLLFSPILPLARPALLPPERLHIVAGVADRIVPPEHPARLAAHWGVAPRWYQGSHLSIRYQPEFTQTLAHAARSAGWD